MNDVLVNDAVLGRFLRLLRTQRLGHAYLFTGPRQAGKTQTALALAQLVNCAQPSQGPCGQCISCRKIASGNHPDVHVLARDEAGSIKIEAVRFLLGRAQLKAYEADTKVFIIRDVEDLTPEAANALLKTLEEPSPHTLMILTTSVPEANPDTIRSRCHAVPFFPSSARSMCEVLAAEGVNARMAPFVAVVADGCLGRARHLARDGIIESKNRVLDRLCFQPRTDDYIKELAADKEAAVAALNVILSFFRDVFLIKSGSGLEQAVHQDRLDDLCSFAGRSWEDLDAALEQTVRTKKLIDDHLNVKMSFTLLKERLWVK